MSPPADASPSDRTILVVDDDPSVTAALAVALGARGYRVVEASGPEEALAAAEAESPALVVQDMNFSRATSGEEGLELLERWRERRSAMPVVLLTAWGTIELAVEGMKAGAADFLTKPWDNEHLLASVATALELAATPAAGEPRARRELDRLYDFSGIVGEDPKLLAVLELVARVAPTDAPVLITGESGTGKELVAEAIHRNSQRRGGRFVKVNLGGISPTLFESEMFGHVRGAFTDARSDRRGRFEMADGGTIFLDEIGEVDPAAQVKLLRVLQDRTYEALGSSVTRRVDARIVAATNRDLGRMVAQESFREDLLYRLNLISLELPPLRERSGDVAALADELGRAAAEAYGRPAPEIAPAARRWLAEQPWPGNVRELKQTVERALLVGPHAAEGRLELEDFRAAPGAAAARPAAELPPPGAMTLEEMERRMVERALERFSGNLAAAARALGLSRPALYRRMEKYGLERPDA